MSLGALLWGTLSRVVQPSDIQKITKLGAGEWKNTEDKAEIRSVVICGHSGGG